MRISDWSSDVCSSDLADNPVERDPGKVRHSRFELVFVGCDQSDPFAFAEEPSGERGYHAYRQVHRFRQVTGRESERFPDVDQMVDLEIAQLRKDRKSTRLNSSH